MPVVSPEKAALLLKKDRQRQDRAMEKVMDFHDQEAQKRNLTQIDRLAAALSAKDAVVFLQTPEVPAVGQAAELVVTSDEVADRQKKSQQATEIEILHEIFKMLDTDPAFEESCRLEDQVAARLSPETKERFRILQNSFDTATDKDARTAISAELSEIRSGQEYMKIQDAIIKGHSGLLRRRARARVETISLS